MSELSGEPYVSRQEKEECDCGGAGYKTHVVGCKHLVLAKARRVKFVTEARVLSNAAYEMMEMWEGELGDALNSNEAILKAYPLPLSFDDWWFEWSNFVDVLERELKTEREI